MIHVVSFGHGCGQVNRLLVKRMTISQAKPDCLRAHLASGNGCQALKEMNFKLISNFFLTTFPTNMLLASLEALRERKVGGFRLKFPVFEIINMAMTFTAFSPGMSGTAEMG